MWEHCLVPPLHLGVVVVDTALHAQFEKAFVVVGHEL
jgi:hypothetical protein